MGTLGTQEIIVICVLALVLFGPKKLPELGKTIGKALTEFRRASNDLKATFDREIQNLERETEAFKIDTKSIANDLYNHANYELPAPETTWNPADHSATQPSTVDASAVSGVESNGTTETAVATIPEPTPAIEGTVARTESGSEKPQHS